MRNYSVASLDLFGGGPGAPIGSSDTTASTRTMEHQTAALQEAASAGLQSMEHLIKTLSQQQQIHRRNRLSLDLNNYNQANNNLDCSELTDFTVSRFKQVISLLNRTGHARFRSAPLRAKPVHDVDARNNNPSFSNTNSFFQTTHSGCPQPEKKIQPLTSTIAAVKILDFAKPAESYVSQFSTSETNSSFMSSITTGDASVSNGKVFAPVVGEATVSNGLIFAPGNGDTSLSNCKTYAPCTGDTSVSNGKIFAPYSGDTSVSSGKIFAPYTGDTSVSNGKIFATFGKPPLASSSLKKKCHDHPASSDISGKLSLSAGKCHCSKRRKSRVKKTIRVPAISSKNADIPPDEYSWRKYGQKPIKGSPYPRGYYKCSTVRGCPARKHVERALDDPGMLVVTYEGDHRHSQPVVPVAGSGLDFIFQSR